MIRSDTFAATCRLWTRRIRLLSAAAFVAAAGTALVHADLQLHVFQFLAEYSSRAVAEAAMALLLIAPLLFLAVGVWWMETRLLALPGGECDHCGAQYLSIRTIIMKDVSCPDCGSQQVTGERVAGSHRDSGQHSQPLSASGKPA